MWHLDNETLILNKRKEERQIMRNLENKVYFWNENTDSTFRLSNRWMYLLEIASSIVILFNVSLT